MPAPKRRLPVDELSTGRGVSLRARAAALAGPSGAVANPTLPTFSAAQLLRSGGVGGPAQVSGVGGPIADEAALLETVTTVSAEVGDVAARGADAAEITAAAYTSATREVQARFPNLTPEEQSDLVVAVAFMTLNGSGQLGNLSMADSGQTEVLPMVRQLQSLEQRYVAQNPGDVNGFMAGPDNQPAPNEGLDASSGSADHLDPRLDDGTAGQAFHTNFFIAAGYVAGDDLLHLGTAQAGNVIHETLDPNAWSGAGGTAQDYLASYVGICIGSALSANRSSGPQLQAGLVYGAMSGPDSGTDSFGGAYSGLPGAELGGQVKELAIRFGTFSANTMASISVVTQGLSGIGYLIRGDGDAGRAFQNMIGQATFPFQLAWINGQEDLETAIAWFDGAIRDASAWATASAFAQSVNGTVGDAANDAACVGPGFTDALAEGLGADCD
ncbi:MAG: hypothetical protein JNK82_43955 [Myxococcaceae bacterium]|nr:hypothetical protein [Myxococcaceae bacterium]